MTVWGLILAQNILNEVIYCEILFFIYLFLGWYQVNILFEYAAPSFLLTYNG